MPASFQPELRCIATLRCKDKRKVRMKLAESVCGMNRRPLSFTLSQGRRGRFWRIPNRTWRWGNKSGFWEFSSKRLMGISFSAFSKLHGDSRLCHLVPIQKVIPGCSVPPYVNQSWLGGLLLRVKAGLFIGEVSPNILMAIFRGMRVILSQGASRWVHLTLSGYTGTESNSQDCLLMSSACSWGGFRDPGEQRSVLASKSKPESQLWPMTWGKSFLKPPLSHLWSKTRNSQGLNEKME